MLKSRLESGMYFLRFRIMKKIRIFGNGPILMNL